MTGTGIAGLTLCGGMGNLRRKVGLAIDNLVSVEIVAASGEVKTASAHENVDLFWGSRGGGDNSGIVTSFEFGLHPFGPSPSRTLRRSCASGGIPSKRPATTSVPSPCPGPCRQHWTGFEAAAQKPL